MYEWRLPRQRRPCVETTNTCAPSEAADTIEPLQFGLKDPSLIHTQGFIAGKWRDAKETFDVTSACLLQAVANATLAEGWPDPATNDVLGSVADMGVAETKEAVNAAAEAFKTWSKTTAKQRHDILMKVDVLYCLSRAR